MKVTDVRIHRVPPGRGPVRAFATITLDDELVIHDFRVVESARGLFVGMPCRKTKQGEWQDIVFAISTPLADHLRETILRAYHDEMAHPGPA
ncbi:MAG: Protein of unknown function identified by role in sporulation (SpoVG) [Candidatus Ozemobacter sibiricus]|uniref:Septation protein SpoVG n=1 Tax=Candidatus Ozemobacter sibiricus TaxID=2268124 RepID=A0A367ZMT7_9BACT|nr:MAG: Protein of unknown function identified by role in sporulation (SpoVG) [Candidatus Ozemobacter sibiricus]